MNVKPNLLHVCRTVLRFVNLGWRSTFPNGLHDAINIALGTRGSIVAVVAGVVCVHSHRGCRIEGSHKVIRGVIGLA
jgi:hypothetical protein